MVASHGYRADDVAFRWRRSSTAVRGSFAATCARTCCTAPGQFRSTLPHLRDRRQYRPFDRHIPFEDRGASAEALMSPAPLVDELKFRGPGGAGRARAGGVPTRKRVPTADLTKNAWRLTLSQLPNHDPANQLLPPRADTRMQEYDRVT